MYFHCITYGIYTTCQISTEFLQWRGEQVEQVFILVVDPSVNGVKDRGDMSMFGLVSRRFSPSRTRQTLLTTIIFTQTLADYSMH